MEFSSFKVEGEERVGAAVRIDDAWELVERFSHLVRESGSADEAVAFQYIAGRLSEWGVHHTLHHPELLISLPRRASLKVGTKTYKAKTPSMAMSTPAAGVVADVVHEATGFAKSVEDIFAPAVRGTADVRGKFVLCEGQAMGGKVAELEARGVAGAIFISPGERIHEGIVTTIWGSPDLASLHRKPKIPVVSVSRPDGEELVRLIEAGACRALMIAEHVDGFVPIPVLVAEIRGKREPERFVMVHGHIDSWHYGVGDNATGDATLLEVARVLNLERDHLERSVRICWWSGHSHGRYAGSTWYADQFALDLEENCICHINCDSPGCRDADSFEDVCAMAETSDFAVSAIRAFAGAGATTRPPVRGGDLSFLNLGLSTLFMLSSNMSNQSRKERGLYGVGGCGGNLEWHTEADTIEIADRVTLLRDMRLYAGTAFRAANLAVHPLDFRSTLAQIASTLDGYEARLGGLLDWRPLEGELASTQAVVDQLYKGLSNVTSIEDARRYNDAILVIGRALVSALYSREGKYRQDVADHIPLLPEFGAAADAVGAVPDGILRTELLRASNRLRRVLVEVSEAARMIRQR
jgi:N-acetylated-alpha-linked acidic dipeptidase